MYACICACMRVFMCVCVFVCMYACMYVVRVCMCAMCAFYVLCVVCTYALVEFDDDPYLSTSSIDVYMSRPRSRSRTIYLFMCLYITCMVFLSCILFCAHVYAFLHDLYMCTICMIMAASPVFSPAATNKLSRDRELRRKGQDYWLPGMY